MVELGSREEGTSGSVKFATLIYFQFGIIFRCKVLQVHKWCV